MIAVNGKKCEVILNSYFVTEEEPKKIIAEYTELLIANLKS